MQRLPTVIVSVSLLAATVMAAVPNRIVYQGRVTKASTPVTGVHSFVARLIAADGSELWKSSEMSIVLSASGEFSLTLEPTGIDWVRDTPRLEVTIDGEKLDPPESFAASPYALVASTALSVNQNATVESAQVKLTGAANLASWQSTTDPTKIDAAKIDTSGGVVIPSGGIILWTRTNTCPPGYTEVNLFHNRVPIGADTSLSDPDVPDSPGQVLGSKNPSHAHVHSIASESPGTNAAGQHSHSGTTGANGAGQVNSGASNNDAARGPHTHSFNTSSDGNHSHTVNSHNHGGNTGAISAAPEVHLPPAVTCLFCMKD
jgi:hypothetical protein